MAKVDKQSKITSPHVDTPCWIWIGSKGGSGYGQFWMENKLIAAHKFLLLIDGRHPLNGQECCHHCDNRLCVRPTHIFFGSRSDNMQDAIRKGRFKPGNTWRIMLAKSVIRRGSSNHASKLTEDDVKLIKSLRKRYGLGCRLARHFKVSEPVISGIWKGKRWPQVEPDEDARQRALALYRVIATSTG